MDGGAARRIDAAVPLVAETCAIGGLGGWAEGPAEAQAGWPGWVPAAARDYIAHVEEGRTIRAIARDAQVHPSTILRRVRRIEASRDDPLVDEALRRLATGRVVPLRPRPRAVEPAAPATSADLPQQHPEQEALPVLRRLAEPATLLAVTSHMEKGVVLREVPGAEPLTLAVIPRTLAETMALRGWIACIDPDARVRRYGIAAAGRSLIRRAAQEARALHEDGEDEDARLRHMRSLLAESPLTALARRRDGEGRPFLSRELVAAGERLREDVELAAQGLPELDWDAVLLAPEEHGAAREGPHHRPEAALGRVARALETLGPGLADVALRCCGMLEGIETLERRLGWSARSGKVVLRIALDRLRRAYRDEDARGGSLIG